MMKLILDSEDINPLEEILASQLSVEMRLLHSIVSHIRFLDSTARELKKRNEK